jgi:iron complex outermembrane receptor protein
LWKNDTTGAYIPAFNTLSDYKTYRTNVDPFITYITRGGSSHRVRTRWFNTTNTNNTDQESKANLFYTEYQFQKKFKKSLTLTAGLVNIFSNIKSELYNNHNGSQHAGYIQTDIQWKKLTLSAGTRSEKNSVDELTDNWTYVYRAGANFHLFSQTYLRASAGQGYRFPSVAERFIKTSIGGVNIFPNPELQPEKGISMEAGVRQMFRFGNWQGFADAALFENDYKNMMEFVFALWGNTHDLFADNGFKSVNIGKTRIRGVEITLAAEGKFGSEFSIAIQAGYTYLDPRQLTYDSAYALKIGPSNVQGTDSTDFLKYRYRHMVKGNVEITRKKISLGIDVRFTSRMENIDKIFTSQFLDNSFQPGLGIGDYLKYQRAGDLVTDIRIRYQFNRVFGISFIVKNALNHIYMQRPADMQPPRSFALQASLKF